MDPISLRDDLRAFLRTRNRSAVARETGIPLSWLSKFVIGAINNPTTKRLDQLCRYRDSVHEGDMGAINRLTSGPEGSAAA
jgi:hypothetical protein